jgi:hypothetical protein
MIEDEDMADEDLIEAARDTTTDPDLMTDHPTHQPLRSSTNLSNLLSLSLPHSLTVLSLPTPLSFPPPAHHFATIHSPPPSP